MKYLETVVRTALEEQILARGPHSYDEVIYVVKEFKSRYAQKRTTLESNFQSLPDDYKDQALLDLRNLRAEETACEVLLKQSLMRYLKRSSKAV